MEVGDNVMQHACVMASVPFKWRHGMTGGVVKERILQHEQIR
jgi:hypothetical protein